MNTNTSMGEIYIWADESPPEAVDDGYQTVGEEQG